MHIPKTAGTVFGSLIRQKLTYSKKFLPKEYLDNIEEVRECKYQMYGGHVPYPVAKKMNVDFDYITMLRNPIDRCVSHWLEFKKYSEYKDLTLDEFIYADEFKNLTTNYYARYLVFEQDWYAINTRTPWEHIIESEKVPMYIDEHRLLYKASQVLNSFKFIGIQEKFFMSIVKFNKIFGIGINEVPTILSSHSDKLSEKYRDELVKRNYVDINLYSYFYAKFMKESV
jgi:hypothetical protein